MTSSICIKWKFACALEVSSVAARSVLVSLSGVMGVVGFCHGYQRGRGLQLFSQSLISESKAHFPRDFPRPAQFSPARMTENTTARQSPLLHGAILLVVCFVCFWWRLGGLGLIDPDEPFYAQTGHEMVTSGDWITPQIYGQPQFEKPILYYWMLAGSYRLFGESEFVGRIPNALSATALVLLVWAFGVRVWGRRAGFLAALIMATGVEFCVMSRLMLTDIPLAIFLSGSVFAYWLAVAEPEKRERWMFLYLVSAGLAVLTKGPIGSIVPLMAVFLFRFAGKQPLPARGRGFWLGVLAYLIIVVPWYGAMFAWHAKPFLEEFFVRDNYLRFLRAEHPANNHFWYYPALLFGGSLPWMPLLAITIKRWWGEARHDRAQLLIGLWFATSLVFLTAAQSKLPTYGFYLFVPLALFAGITADTLLREGFRTRGEKGLAIGFAIFQLTAAAVAPFIKAAAPFKTPALLVAAILALAVALLFRRDLRAWFAVSATASATLIASALVFAREPVEAESSALPVVQAIRANQQPGEPILSSKFLIRGLIYYTRQDITVLASDEHPFWADHPLPVLVWNGDALKRYFEKTPVALCALRKGDWSVLKNKPTFKNAEILNEFGQNLIVRVRSSEPAQAGNSK